MAVAMVVAVRGAENSTLVPEVGSVQGVTLLVGGIRIGVRSGTSEEANRDVATGGASGRSNQDRIKELSRVATAFEIGSDEWLDIMDIVYKLRGQAVVATAVDDDVYEVDATEDDVSLEACQVAEAMPEESLGGNSLPVPMTGSTQPDLHLSCNVDRIQPSRRKNPTSLPQPLSRTGATASGVETYVATARSVNKSSDPQPRRELRKYIKLSEYDGMTPWPIFHRLFESCSKFNGWDEAERVIHLQVALQGAAQQVLWTDGREEWTSEDLLAELSKRFSPESQIDQYRAALFVRKRHRGETIENLGQDIARLAAQAFPGPKDATKEMLAIDAFVRAIGNQDLGFHMKRTASVKTLADAVCYAQQYEAAYASRSDDDTVYVEQRRDKDRNRNKVAAARDDQDDEKSQRDSEMEKMRLLIEKLQTQQQAQQESLSKISDVATAQSRQPTFNRGGGNGYRGGSSSRGRNSGYRRNDGATGGQEQRVCFNCDKPGHLARNCYLPKRQKDLPVATVSQPQKDNVDATTKTAGVNGPSAYWTRPAMLAVKMNGATRLCLIDTGCGTTMVPPHCVKGLKMKKTDRVFTNASNDAMKILGTVNLRIRLDERIMDIDAVVSSDCDEPMLGADWIEKYQVTVIVHEGVVSVGGVKYKLLPRNRDQNVCRVVATETCVIPARSATVVGSSLRICNISERTPQPCLEDWMAEPAEISKGVYVGRTLLPRLKDNLPVSVVNVTNRAVRIDKGAVIAEAVPVNVTVPQPDSGTSQPEEGGSQPDSAGAQPDQVMSQPVKRRRKNYKHLEPLLEGLSKDMTRLEREQLWEMLKSYADVFSSGKFDMGRTTLVAHHIDTGESQPVKQRLRKQAWAHQEVIATERKELSEADLVTEYNGPWCSNVVIVTKKDGSPRFCIDYRKLNELTKKDAYPLPSIEVCLDALAGSRYFSTFDLRSGYHQIPMDQESIEKTAFVTREGTYAFKVMPFGLCNAGATFQRLMDLLMAGITYRICLVYLDDIIVFSRNLEQHLERCRIVFQRLRSAGLKLKVSKCNLVRDSVQFLGHIVSGEGVATDPEKIEKVRDWPQPRNLHDVKAFYGLCSYYRKFVQDFATVAAPLTRLMRKEDKFVWDDGCDEAFSELKNRLITSPILALPQPQGRFILDTDASNFAIGGVLSQVQGGLERVVAYGSRSLSKEEKNYCVTRRELLAVTDFLKKYRQYLLGRKFTIRTDHAALTWMRRTPEPIGQQARWISLVEEFDFDIEYRPGKAHGNADALSRMPCPEECKQCTGKANNRVAAIRQPPRVQDATALDYGDEAVATATDEDISLRHIKEWLRQGSQPLWESVRNHNSEVKTLVKMWDRLVLKNGVIYRAWVDDNGVAESYQKVLPYIYHRDFVRIVHSGMNGGHLGEKKTRHGVQLRAYWVGWKTTVHQVLQSCEPCQKYHRGKVQRQGAMQDMTMGAPWERLGVDITGPFPRSARGNKYMITLIDHFTKWAEAVPIPNHEATTVSRVLLEQVITRFGVPQQILTDRGAEFESQLFKELCRILGCDKIRTTSYKPSTNGAIERLHRSLNSMIGKVIDLDQRHWDEQVPIVMAAYRASRHETTGYTPNYLMFGREVSMPVDIVSGVPEELKDLYKSENEYVANLQDKLRQVYEKTRIAMGRAAERNKKQYDISVKSKEYKVGDWVLYYLPKATQGRCIKFERLFSGPFLVVKKYSGVLYSIQATKKSQPKTVHIDKLKYWFGETPQPWIREGDNVATADLNMPLVATDTDNSATGITVVTDSNQCQNSSAATVTPATERGNYNAIPQPVDSEGLADERRNRSSRFVTQLKGAVEKIMSQPTRVTIVGGPKYRGKGAQPRGRPDKRSRNRESTELTSDTAARRAVNDAVISQPYRPPATRANVATARRTSVSTPTVERMSQPRANRNQLPRRLRDFQVYKVAQVKEISFPKLLFTCAQLERINMAKVRTTPKQGKDGVAVEGQIKDVKVKGGKGKVATDVELQCPFAGCASGKTYCRLPNLNCHAKVAHGGTYEIDTNGNMTFFAATAEQARVWKEKEETRRQKDRAGRKHRAQPKKDDEANTSQPTYDDVSSDTTVIDDDNNATASEGNVATASNEDTVAADFLATAMSQSGVLENVATADDVATTSAVSTVATVPSQPTKSLFIKKARSSHEILNEQLCVQPPQRRVAELDVSNKTVADVVIELRRTQSDDSGIALPQPRSRVSSVDSAQRKTTQHLAGIQPQPGTSKRAATATKAVMSKRVKTATDCLVKNVATVVNPTVVDYFDRVIEAGKWLVGQVPNWNKKDRATELADYLRMPQREAHNIIVAFGEGFRAAAAQTVLTVVKDAANHPRVMSSALRPFLSLTHASPPRIDSASKWGATGVTSKMVESMAVMISQLLPSFSINDVMDTAKMSAMNIPAEIVLQIAQVVCAACQLTVRQLVAFSGRCGTFVDVNDGVYVNGDYLNGWSVLSEWLVVTLDPALLSQPSTSNAD